MEQEDRRKLTSAGLTYFYLVKIWNGCGRPEQFRRQNNLICAELGLSKPTLERHREALKEVNLINFFSRGKGDPNITYQIIEVTKYSYRKPEKEKNITSGVTSHDDIKHSTEIFIVINKEVKLFSYFKELFNADPGLKIVWRNNGFPAEKFDAAVQAWMILNQLNPYHDFAAARKHFLFWIPSYYFELEKSNKTHAADKSNFKTKSGPINGKSAGANQLLDKLAAEIKIRGC
jgi:hypothetical protein